MIRQWGHVVPELVMGRRGRVGDGRDAGRRRTLGRAALVVVVVVVIVVVVAAASGAAAAADGVAGPIEAEQLLDGEGRALRHLRVRARLLKRRDDDATTCLRPASSAQVDDVHALIQDCRFFGICHP